MLSCRTGVTVAWTGPCISSPCAAVVGNSDQGHFLLPFSTLTPLCLFSESQIFTAARSVSLNFGWPSGYESPPPHCNGLLLSFLLISCCLNLAALALLLPCRQTGESLFSLGCCHFTLITDFEKNYFRGEIRELNCN